MIGDQIRVIHIRDDYNRWETYRKNVKTYNSAGNILSDYTYDWEPYEGIWEKRTDFWIEYDSQGRILKQMKSNLGSSQLTEYQYDSLGNYIVFVANSAPWIGNYNPHIKYEISVNTNGQKIKQLMYKSVNSVWEYYTKDEYSYQPDGIISRESFFAWDEDNNQWTLSRRNHYFYRTQISNLNDIEVAQLLIFPNPTSGIINITGLTQPAEVKIYSLQGQLLKSELNFTNTIDIYDLPAGVYFLNLTSGQTVLKKTLIKR
jgi:hypothetical protein